MGLNSDPEPASQQPIAGLHAGRGRSFDLAAVRSHAEIITGSPPRLPKKAS
jgi:hypothetical protein